MEDQTHSIGGWRAFRWLVKISTSLLTTFWKKLEVRMAKNERAPATRGAKAQQMVTGSNRTVITP